MKRTHISLCIVTVITMSTSYAMDNDQPDNDTKAHIFSCESVIRFIEAYIGRPTRGNLQHVVDCHASCTNQERITLPGSDKHKPVAKHNRETVLQTLHTMQNEAEETIVALKTEKFEPVQPATNAAAQFAQTEFAYSRTVEFKQPLLANETDGWNPRACIGHEQYSWQQRSWCEKTLRRYLDALRDPDTEIRIEEPRRLFHTRTMAPHEDQIAHLEFLRLVGLEKAMTPDYPETTQRMIAILDLQKIHLNAEVEDWRDQRRDHAYLNRKNREYLKAQSLDKKS